MNKKYKELTYIEKCEIYSMKSSGKYFIKEIQKKFNVSSYTLKKVMNEFPQNEDIISKELKAIKNDIIRVEIRNKKTYYVYPKKSIDLIENKLQKYEKERSIFKGDEQEKMLFNQLLELYNIDSYKKLENLLEEYQAMKKWFEETKVMFEIYGCQNN